MPDRVKPSRNYHSPKRKQQAARTRTEILNAARELFVEGGFTGTTITSIADRAGVSPETVYATFGSKRAILWRLLEIAAAGDEEPIPVRERSWVTDMRQEDDPRRRIDILAAATREIMARSGDLLTVLRDAAASDPELRATWEEANSLMLEDHEEFVRVVAEGGELREGMDVTSAADILWTLAAPEVHRRLVTERGWPADRYERWLADTLAHQLLP